MDCNLWRARCEKGTFAASRRFCSRSCLPPPAWDGKATMFSRNSSRNCLAGTTPSREVQEQPQAAKVKRQQEEELPRTAQKWEHCGRHTEVSLCIWAVHRIQTAPLVRHQRSVDLLVPALIPVLFSGLAGLQNCIAITLIYNFFSFYTINLSNCTSLKNLKGQFYYGMKSYQWREKLLSRHSKCK